jgi:hypothetical protein
MVTLSPRKKSRWFKITSALTKPLMDEIEAGETRFFHRVPGIKVVPFRRVTA